MHRQRTRPLLLTSSRVPIMYAYIHTPRSPAECHLHRHYIHNVYLHDTFLDSCELADIRSAWSFHARGISSGADGAAWRYSSPRRVDPSLSSDRPANPYWKMRKELGVGSVMRRATKITTHNHLQSFQPHTSLTTCYTGCTVTTLHGLETHSNPVLSPMPMSAVDGYHVYLHHQRDSDRPIFKQSPRFQFVV